MRVTILGAGAVGLRLAGRLAASGTAVQLVTRRAAAAEAIARDGVRLEDPASGAAVEAALDAVHGLDAASDLAAGPVVLCLRASETRDAARDLAARAPGAVVASAQNDVDNEAWLAERFAHVLGIVVRQTCTQAGLRTVRAAGAGRLVIGRHPSGQGDASRALADRFAAAGFDVGRSDAIGRDKWLKLCVNLTSSVNALVRRADHRRPAFVELKVRLLEEARDALAAARIEAGSCDGRDRDLDAEIAALRASLADGSSARELPLYNACWTALRDPTRPLEADAYHRRILALASEHGTRAPAHRALLDAVCADYAAGRGPERRGADELLALAAERA